MNLSTPPSGAVSALLLSGCSSGEASPDVRQAESAQTIVDQARAAVLSSLRDPNSAEFRNVYANAKNIVCGTVNAKNAFGGYAGFSAFWYDPKTGEAFLYDPDQDGAGKAYDALIFDKQGCSIGNEQQSWLETAKMINEGNKRVGLEPIGPDE